MVTTCCSIHATLHARTDCALVEGSSAAQQHPVFSFLPGGLRNNQHHLVALALNIVRSDRAHHPAPSQECRTTISSRNRDHRHSRPCRCVLRQRRCCETDRASIPRWTVDLQSRLPQLHPRKVRWPTG